MLKFENLQDEAFWPCLIMVEKIRNRYRIPRYTSFSIMAVATFIFVQNRNTPKPFGKTDDLRYAFFQYSDKPVTTDISVFSE